MANEITANVKFPWGGVGPKTFLQAPVATYTTASDSGIVLGSAVGIVSGNAVLAQADASGPLAMGLVSKIISATQCEIMTGGVYTAYPGSFTPGNAVYLSAATPGALTQIKPTGSTEFVQLIGVVLDFDGDVGNSIELRVGGLKNTDTSKVSRTLDILKTTVSGGVGISTNTSYVVDPQATLHVLGTGLITGRSSTPILTLSRNDSSITEGDVLGHLSFCGLETLANSPAAGTEGAYIKAVSSGTWNSGGTLPSNMEFYVAGAGTFEFNSGIDVTGSSLVRNKLTVSATEVNGSYELYVDGNAAVATSLDIGGGYGATGVTLGATGNVQANGTLTVDGATTINDILTVDGATTINDTLTVTALTTLDGLVAGDTELASLSVQEASNFDNNLTVRTKLAVGSEDTTIADLYVDGTAVVTGDLRAGDTVTAHNSITLHKDTAAGIVNNTGLGTVNFTAKQPGGTSRTTAVISIAGTETWDANSFGAELTIAVTDGVEYTDPVAVFSHGLLHVVGNITATGTIVPFTGAHVYPVAEAYPAGAVLVLNAQTVSLATVPRAKNCAGIVVKTCRGAQSSLGEVEETLLAEVAAVGDSRTATLPGFLVCNENGPIAAGDLLCTSSVPGHLMKQDDDILRAYTVGKAMQDVVFDESGKASGVYGYIYCG